MSDEAGEGIDLSKYVPKDRFLEVNKEKRAALARLSEMEDQIKTLQQDAGTVENLRARIGELEGEVQTANARYERHTAISGAGITDPSVVEYIEYAYGKLDDAPPMAEYVKGLLEDPTQAPTVLRPHLESLGQPAGADASAETARPPQGEASAPAPQAPARPNTNPHVGVQPTPAPAGDLSEAQIANSSDAEWRAIREQEIAKRRRTF